MRKIAVLGDRESICGFACLGIDTVEVYGGQDAKEKFHRLVEDDYAIIYITELYAAELKEEISALSEVLTPAVILIPGIKGNTGEGMKNIDKSVERAVGSILLN